MQLLVAASPTHPPPLPQFCACLCLCLGLGLGLGCDAGKAVCLWCGPLLCMLVGPHFIPSWTIHEHPHAPGCSLEGVFLFSSRGVCTCLSRASLSPFFCVFRRSNLFVHVGGGGVRVFVRWEVGEAAVEGWGVYTCVAVCLNLCVLCVGAPLGVGVVVFVGVVCLEGTCTAWLSPLLGFFFLPCGV